MQSSVLLYQTFKAVSAIMKLEFGLLFTYSCRLRFCRTGQQPGMDPEGIPCSHRMSGLPCQCVQKSRSHIESAGYTCKSSHSCLPKYFNLICGCVLQILSKGIIPFQTAIFCLCIFSTFCLFKVHPLPAGMQVNRLSGGKAFSNVN